MAGGSRTRSPGRIEAGGDWFRVLLALISFPILFCAGCLKLNITNTLGCSPAGNCPSPYRCVGGVCVPDPPDAGSDGGAAGAGGNIGTGGTAGPIVVTDLGTFDTDVQEFKINIYNVQADVNLGASTTNPATLFWEPVEGSPNPGSLQLIVPFTDYNQYVDVVKNFPTTGLQDWSGKTLRVRLKVASGGNPPGAPMSVQVGVNSYRPDAEAGPDRYPFAGNWVTELAAGWQEFTFNASDANAYLAPGWDPTQVVSFGIEIHTLTPNPLPSTKPTTAVIYIDSFSLVGPE